MSDELLHCAFFPTKVILIDDDDGMLEQLIESLSDEFHCLTFNRPQEAAVYINEHHKKNRLASIYVDHEEMSKPEHKTVSVNVRAVYKEIYNPKRFDDIAVVVTDFAMPGKTGIEFCGEISSTIKKIMLTGEADLQTAIIAFNDKLIHQYIRKDESDFVEHTREAIRKFQKIHFQEQMLFLSRSLAKSKIFPTSCLTDQAFIEYFYKTCQKLNIVEFYITDSRGCFLLLDKNAKPTWLAVSTDQVLEDFAIYAEEDEASAEIIDAMQKREQQPFFFNDEDYKIRPQNWLPFMHKVIPIQGKQTYYCSLITNTNLYDLEKEKVRSYEDYLEKFYKDH